MDNVEFAKKLLKIRSVLEEAKRLAKESYNASSEENAVKAIAEIDLMRKELKEQKCDS